MYSFFLAVHRNQKNLNKIITVNNSTNAPITKNNSCMLCVPMFFCSCNDGYLLLFIAVVLFDAYLFVCYLHLY